MTLKELQQSVIKEKNNYYTIAVQCLNCGFEPNHLSGPWNGRFPDEIVIPKGTTIKDHTKDVVCPICGCVGFK